MNSLLRSAGRNRSQQLRHVLEEVAERAGTMAFVHEELDDTRGNQDVQHDTLLNRLCQDPAIILPERPIAVACRADPIVLSVERAIPVAPIVVEALTNAVHRGLPDCLSGGIAVELRVCGEAVVLEIGGDGSGLAAGPSVAGPSVAGTSALGFIEALARQPGGAFEASSNSSTRLTVTFPLSLEASADAADTS